jgi:hypothetical protein
MNFTYPADGLFATDGSMYHDGLIEATNASGIIWYGPYVTLYPGTYNITFLIDGNMSPSSEVLLQVTSNCGNTVLAQRVVKGGEINGWTPVTLRMNLNSTQQFVEFRGWAMGLEGTVELKGVAVEGQLGAG